MKIECWLISFCLLMACMSLVSADDNTSTNPYADINLSAQIPAQVVNTSYVNLTQPDISGHWDYVEIDNSTHKSHFGRLTFETSPYIKNNGNDFFGLFTWGASNITELDNDPSVNQNNLTTQDDTGDIRLSNLFYQSLIKEKITLNSPVDEIGYIYNTSLQDWTTLEPDLENNTTRSVTNYAKDSTTDVELDQWGNAVVLINGAETMVLPVPTATDATGTSFNLSWELDKQNSVLKIGDLHSVENAAFPVTIDPTELITNGGFETGNLSGWTTSGTGYGAGAFTVTSVDHHSGTYSIYVGTQTANSGSAWTVTSTLTQNVVSPSPGTMSCYYKLKPADTYNYGTNQNINLSYGNQYIVWGGLNNSWTYISSNYSLTGNNAYTVKMNATAVLYSGSTYSLGRYFWLDDCSMLAASAPTASFTSNITSGTYPLTVQFNDTSSGAPTAWSWNFSDGSANSTSQNPSHTFIGTGTFTVTLNASNAYGSSTTTSTITVNKATPIITWSPSPSTITYGTGLATGQLSPTTTVSGSFVYNYTGASVYVGSILPAGTDIVNTTFTPSDTTNYTTAYGNATITVNKATPSLSWSPSPSTITYGTGLVSGQLNAASGGLSGSFGYTFGGATVTAGSILPAGSDTLTATFTPTDTTNYTSGGTVTTSITVNQAIPTISWTNPAAITYPTALSGTQLNANTGGIAGGLIYTPSSGSVLSAGTHTLHVDFTPTDSTNYTTASKDVPITVNKATPTITWSPNPSTMTVNTGLVSGQLNANSGGIAGSFAYRYGGTSIYVGYTGLPVGTDTLTADFTPSDTTNYNTASHDTDIVVNNKITPSFTWATPTPIYYGTALSGTQLNAAANVTGTYTYTPISGTVLSVGDHNLHVDFVPTDTSTYNSVSADVTLTVYKANPVITWNAPSAITYGTLLSGTQLNAACSTPGTMTYTPGAGTLLNGGLHTLSVTFYPTDTVDYNSNTASVPITVNKATPSITWGIPATINYGTALSSAQLNAASTTPGSFTYTPDTGTVLSAGAHTLHTDFTPTDTTDYNTASADVNINVNKSTPTITWSNPSNIVVGTVLNSTQLNAVASVPGSYAYYPASGTVLGVGNNQNLQVIFTPTDSTNYSTATKTVQINVMVEPIAPDFHANVTTSDTGDIAFTDDSVATVTIDEWNWDFGDGGHSTIKNPTHHYAAIGTYSVSLTAGNISGGSTGSTTKTNYITVTNPVSVDFTGSPLVGLSPLAVQFNDLSSGSPTSWFWDFGDGTTSNLQNPVHVYNSSGNYTVSLTAGNTGSTHTTTKTSYVNVKSSSSTTVESFSNVSGSWVCPSGVTSINVKLVGPGGPSGFPGYGAANTGSSYGGYSDYGYQAGGGGGGSSGEVRDYAFTVTPGQTYYFTVDYTGTYWGTPSTHSGLAAPGNQGGNGTDAVMDTSNGTGGAGGAAPYGGTAGSAGTNGSLYQISFQNGNIYSNRGFIASGAGGSGGVGYVYGGQTYGVGGHSTSIWYGAPHPGYYPGGNAQYGTTGCVLISYSAPAIGASFTSTPTEGVSGTQVQFTDTSQGTPTNWNWNFGDGTTSTDHNPIHIYASPGRYNVTLFAYNSAYGNTLTKSGYIKIGGVYGQVYDTTNFYYLGNVTATLANGSKTYNTKTDTSGHYYFYYPDPGVYTLTLSRKGYDTYTEQVNFTGISDINETIGMDQSTSTTNYTTPHYATLYIFIDNWWTKLPNANVSITNDVGFNVTGTSDSTGALTAQLSQNVKYTIKTSYGGSTQVDTIYGGDNSYYILFDTSSATPANFYDTVNITVTKNQISPTAAYINLSYVDNESKTNSLTVRLGQYNNTHVFQELNNTTIAISGLSSGNASFIVNNYLGQQYTVILEANHQTYGTVKKYYAVAFEGNNLPADVQQNPILGWFGILLLIIVGLMFDRATHAAGGILTCGFFWVLFFMGIFTGLGSGAGIMFIGGCLASPLAFLIYFNEKKNEG